MFSSWVLPRHAPRVIIMHTKVSVLGSIQELWDLFDHFESTLVRLADEQQALYKPLNDKNGWRKPYDLDGIRSLDFYLNANKALDVDGYRMGYMGDQTYYTILNYRHPRTIHQVTCAWNFQLGTHFGIDDERFRRCDDDCSLIHATHAPVKCVVQQRSPHKINMTYSVFRHFVERPACFEVEESVRTYCTPVLRRFFMSCCNSN